jgi:DNA glycosylase AlkZ-like
VTLTARALNRTVLARQLLLARARIPIGRALERVAGLQAQYAPSPYIRLWSMLDGFAVGDLTHALERRWAVQGTLMRSTIHIVSPRDYWHFAAGIGPSRQEWWIRAHGLEHDDIDFDEGAADVRRRLAGRTWHRKELDTFFREKGFPNWTAAWVELVREPPSGTWEHRRADLFRLAAEWLRPAKVSEDEGLERLLRRYLAAFGPGTLADAAKWAGVDRAKLLPVAEQIRLRVVHDEDGNDLVDLPRAPRAAEDTPAPPRFLGTWDTALLVHVRRTQILPERFRPLVFSTKAPQSFATFLVDGSVAGTWRVERAKGKATLRLEPFEPLPRAALGDVSNEGERLVRFHEPDAVSFAVRVRR